MDSRGKTILVVGATGHQGGAAAHHLLNDGWSVRALVRDLNKPAARALAEQGAELVVGNLLDRASLDAAVEGAYGVYSMETPFEAGAQTEEQEGRNIADAAAAAGVEHFVYSSVMGADTGEGPDWVLSKHHVEEHIEKLSLPATIWRPALFMENFLGQEDEILDGHLRGAAWPETRNYYIAVDDIGRFIALAFRSPERFIGTRMAIAGDTMTLAQVAETFTRVLGVRVEYERLETPGTPAQPRPEPDVAQPVLADIEACKELLPNLVTLEQWAEATGWRARVHH